MQSGNKEERHRDREISVGLMFSIDTDSAQSNMLLKILLQTGTFAESTALEVKLHLTFSLFTPLISALLSNLQRVPQVSRERAEDQHRRSSEATLLPQIAGCLPGACLGDMMCCMDGWQLQLMDCGLALVPKGLTSTTRQNESLWRENCLVKRGYERPGVWNWD